MPSSAKFSNSGQVLAIVAWESDRISVRKSKSCGGGLIETLNGFMGLVDRRFGFAEKMGKVAF